ncbi:MAG: nucleotidyltransferase family protein [Anaerolineaceae bacterium]|nr:nucleotidyltransferase family protein [Anaerolineaceae bacterium]MDD4041917.1 nucleotidyltransferase family protein [Anaerolineaceae bacterium]MDD4577943.1 nucleotidyltransferase family protein [Anaerolineaceae bacterium]
MKVVGIVLAAGGASRFGEIKQLLPWREKNLVNTVVETAQIAGLDPIIVVLGASAEQIRATVPYSSAQVVINPDWEQGQSTSLKTGVKAISGNVDGALFLLCDQPQISVNLVSSVVEEGLRTGKVVVPVIDDRRANPVYFPAVCFPLFETLEGDAGGRQIVSACPHTTLIWMDDWMARDIDTPGDYLDLREHFGL